jgi:hypothetical protein
MFALNWLVKSNYVFGRDVAFTYGPLGFLLNPMDVGSNLAVAACFWSALQAGQFTLIFWKLRNHPMRLCGFCGLYVLLIGLGLWQEYRLFCFVALLIVCSVEEAGRHWLAALAGFFSFFLLEIKWNVGVSALAQLGAGWILLLATKRTHAATTILCGAGGVIAALILSLALFFHSPMNLVNWVRLSMNFTLSYSSTMSIEGPSGVLLFAGLDALIFVALYFLLSQGSRTFLLLLIVPLFLAFKEGFVRQDGHSLAYFSFLPLSILLVFFIPEIPPPDARRLATGAAITMSIGFLCASLYQMYPALQATEVGDLIVLRKGEGDLAAVLHLAETRRSLQSTSAVELQSSSLSPAWRARLAQSGVRTSVVPWELSIAAANPIRWEPLPTLQLYAAANPYLDFRNAQQIRENGAEFFIAQYQTIDGRNLFSDTPETWREILNRYELADSDPVKQFVLLHRKAPTMQELSDVVSGRAPLDAWVPVPATRNLLFADLDLHLTVPGALKSLLYQVPPAFFEVQRKSGQTQRYRLIISNARDGVLINYLPVSQAEFEDLFEGFAADPVVRFRVLSIGGGRALEPNFAWRIQRSNRQISERGDIAEPPSVTTALPAEAGGKDAVIEVTATDPNGWRYIQYVQILVSKELDGANACYISYQVGGNRLWLISDAGSGGAGNGPPGDAAILRNKQCSVPLAGTSVTFDQKAIDLKVSMKFQSSFKGIKRVLAYAIDRRSRHSEWKHGGDWEVR